jgi:hypothetical protein
MAVDLTTAQRLIQTVRGQRVILSPDLALMYGVETRALNQAVRRNRDRFPPDFAFLLTREEADHLQRSRSQSVILKRGANIKHFPLAFTEHGAIMAATILNSPRAVRASILVVRAFLRLRQWVADHAQLSARLADLERRVGRHDGEIGRIIAAVRQLVNPVSRVTRRAIGFSAAPPNPGPARSGPRSRAIHRVRR